MGTFDLIGRKILIAGANGLIGEAVSNGVKEHGGLVIDADIREGEYGTYLNLSDGGKSLAKILQEEGILHGFVNVTYPHDFITHTTGWLTAMRIVAEHMYQNNTAGSIINFSSIYGLVGVDRTRYEYTDMKPPSEEYALIKGGIIAASRMMATEFGLHNIRINTIAPGGVEHHQHKTFRIGYEADTPMNRMAEPEDIVGTVIYLLSDASKYVTGVCIPVDGGYTAW
jgi:NAD(P)-dependent dehydrogenase (short-subunit alcohol dehydrogenase family)